jgi:hypothetical protein
MDRERLENYAESIKATAAKLEKLWPSIRWTAGDGTLRSAMVCRRPANHRTP